MTFGATFLRQPDRFPNDIQSEGWGQCEVTLDLPGGPYRLAGLSEAQERSVREIFPASREVQASDRLPVPITLWRYAAEEFAAVDTRGWDYALDFDFAATQLRIAGLGFMARLDGLPRSGTQRDGSWPVTRLSGRLWTSADGGVLFPGIFENFLRVLVAYRLLELGGAVLHSAGVVKEGKGYVFLGHSGAGKSTVSGLSQAQGGEVLSDDLNALCPTEEGRCEVLKLPFTGEIGDRRVVRRPVPLGALLWLQKDVREELLPMSRARIVACMMACAPFLNADPYRRETLEEVLLSLVTKSGAPSFMLRFSLTGAFWSIIG